ncbi:MAG TPA: MoaD/ThiS family protein [Thermoplasmata archaeon]|nr:MoaD/ThiS family protein [Thermoplasmata archaeon]
MASRTSPEELARSAILVRIPPALRTYTGGQDEVVLEASDLGSLVDRLETAFPGIRDRIVDETGHRREYVNLFVNDELARSPLREVRLEPGDVVHILPSVAGG